MKTKIRPNTSSVERQNFKKNDVEVHVNSKFNTIEVYTNDWCNNYQVVLIGKRASLKLIESVKCDR